MFLLLWIALAHAMTCEEVLNMVDVGVPTAIVVQALQAAGPLNSAGVACLVEHEVDPSILTAAKGVDGAAPSASPAAPVEPEALPDLPPPPGIAPRILKHPRKATLALSARGSVGTPSERQLRHVWMGRSLLAMGLVHAAGREFDAAIALRTEGPVFVNALEGLGLVADRTGDSTWIADWVAKIPLANFHASQRDRVAWWMAVQSYEAGSLQHVRQWVNLIPKKSPYYLRSRYLEAVLHNRSGKLKSAVRSFREVAQTPGADPTLKDLALLSLARVFYGIERYDEAAKYDALIPAGSPFHDEALLELAWAQFMRNDLEGMTASLQAIDPKRSWLPERALLEGIAAYSQERYGATTAAIEELEALRPVEAVLGEVLTTYTRPENRPPTGALYATYLEPEAASGIPAPLLALLRQDTELQGLISHLQMMKREEDRIQHEPKAWRRAVGDGLQAAFSADRADLEAKAGEILLRHIAEQDRALVDLLDQAQILKFEVAVATHADTAGPQLRALIAESQGEKRSEMRFRLAQNYAAGAAEEIALYEQIEEETPAWPRAPAVTLALAEARWQAGQRKAALELLETLILRWPEALEVVQARLLLGDNAFEHKDWAAARSWYGAASAGPNSAQQMYIRYRLAWCDWAQGAHIRAIKAMKAVSADPADPELGKRAAQDLHRMAPDGRL